MKVKLPPGDVLDKATILHIKAERLDDPDKVANVRRELEALTEAWSKHGMVEMESVGEWAALLEVNRAMWVVEEALRAHESRGEFGDRFVSLARAVYRLNDHRTALKRAASLRLGPGLGEGDDPVPDYNTTKQILAELGLSDVAGSAMEIHRN
ncbi:Hypp3093 [Branchiostoma lanceolatum]|uniref:Hypp3093 protein n=1 Tax=Branchiostoma lanceolatum TaxID=7740 RepID=A0A8J9ZWQ8_BRALA|nr:Hypp3093 [Branchiostoma lanceolatum]